MRVAGAASSIAVLPVTHLGGPADSSYRLRDVSLTSAPAALMPSTFTTGATFSLRRSPASAARWLTCRRGLGTKRGRDIGSAVKSSTTTRVSKPSRWRRFGREAVVRAADVGQQARAIDRGHGDSGRSVQPRRAALRASRLCERAPAAEPLAGSCDLQTAASLH